MIKNNLQTILISICIVLSLLGSCNSCNTNRKQEVANKRLEKLEKIYTKDELDKKLEILSLETERSTLLNTNYIFLTKARPDSRLIEIDKRIKEISNK
jgi:4-hydroxy-3-methylbut-2-enyl diphosphate reductase IspH